MRRTDTFDGAEVLDNKPGPGEIGVKAADWPLLGPEGFARACEI